MVRKWYVGWPPFIRLLRCYFFYLSSRGAGSAVRLPPPRAIRPKDEESCLVIYQLHLLALLPPIAVVDSEQNLDNPAVQLQGPFLQDRVNPPPARRNVIMIAAGTGINPSEKGAALRCDGSI